MKTIVIDAFGDTSVLNYVETATPVAGPGEVLINVKAISINPVDAKTRGGGGMAGRLKQYMPLTLGWDVAGIIAAVGEGVTRFAVGDEVFGMVNFPGHGRAYAEVVAAPATHLAKKPNNISFAEAAAATLAPLTAWQAFTEHEQIKPGQRVLIHAGAGGVGHYAIQLAKHLGAYVIATSSAANRNFVLSLGADEHIDYRAVAFEDAVKDVDFVLDTIGGDNITRSLQVIKPGGILISIPSGVNEDLMQNAREKGVKAYFILVKSSGKDMQAMADFLAGGQLRSHVSQVFDFENMAGAHTQIETGRTVGKIVVTL